MRYSVAVKFIAVLLCALSLVCVVASGFGLLFMENWNLYTLTLDDLKQQEMDAMSEEIAWYYAQLQAANSLSNCPQEILDDALTYSSVVQNLHGSECAVEIYEGNTKVFTLNDPDQMRLYYCKSYDITPNYPIVTSQYTQKGFDDTFLVEENEAYAEATEISDEANETGIEPTVPGTDETEDTDGVTEPGNGETAAKERSTATQSASIASAITPQLEEALNITGEDTDQWVAEREEALSRVEGQDIIFSSSHSEDVWTYNGDVYNVVYVLDYYAGPQYQVKVYLTEGALHSTPYALMSVLYPYRDSFMSQLLLGLLVFAATLVYLCVASGKSKTGEVNPAGLNRLPLDLYALGAGTGGVLLCILMVLMLDTYGTGYYGIWDNIPLCMLVLALGGFAICLLGIGLLCAFTAQLKLKGGYWWRHSICGWCLCKVHSGCRMLSRMVRSMFAMLPMSWQWLATAALMVLAPLFFIFLCGNTYGIVELFAGLMILVTILADILVVCYGGWCFAVLFKGTKHMAQGNLDYKINTKYLCGSFKDFGNQLNRLAEAAKIAAERQMKSERMKTELITNVSHDIKTPLTSIINFVDLLKKTHSDAEGEQYLEVLDRQSQRLKKLIDDLMEMSKASSGNLAVELGRVDAAEAINQALGEFADKLERVNLTPVFRYPQTPVTMMADGRLVWRVLSNLLSNAVKYALPDTRLYVDLMVLQGNAVIAIKNISKDQLNVNADELMERFVRGDTARNTEGSGLGLNIAKSLVELQHGQMHLMVDGDLFKVTLIFPCA